MPVISVVGSSISSVLKWKLSRTTAESNNSSATSPTMKSSFTVVPPVTGALEVNNIVVALKTVPSVDKYGLKKLLLTLMMLSTVSKAMFVPSSKQEKKSLYSS